MLTSSESVALNFALTFLNAVLHYILYRVAVAFILFVKGSIFWVLDKSERFFHRPAVVDSRRNNRSSKSRERDDSPDEYVATWGDATMMYSVTQKDFEWPRLMPLSVKVSQPPLRTGQRLFCRNVDDRSGFCKQENYQDYKRWTNKFVLYV